MSASGVCRGETAARFRSFDDLRARFRIRPGSTRTVRPVPRPTRSCQTDSHTDSHFADPYPAEPARTGRRSRHRILTCRSEISAFAADRYPFEDRSRVGTRFGRNGAPGRIRTSDRLVRSQVLYPTELRARCSAERGLWWQRSAASTTRWALAERSSFADAARLRQPVSSRLSQVTRLEPTRLEPTCLRGRLPSADFLDQLARVIALSRLSRGHRAVTDRLAVPARA